MLSDTTPEAERIQLALLRQAGPEGRQRMLLELTDEVIDLTLLALLQRHPGLSEVALRLEFIQYCYGAALASEVRCYGRPQ